MEVDLINKMAEGQMKMGENSIGRAFKIADEDRGALGDEGRRLPVYSIGGGSEGRILSAGCGTSYEMKLHL